MYFHYFVYVFICRETKTVEVSFIQWCEIFFGWLSALNALHNDNVILTENRDAPDNAAFLNPVFAPIWQAGYPVIEKVVGYPAKHPASVNC